MTDVVIAVQIAWDGTSWDDVTDDIRQQPGFSVETGKDTARPRAQPMIASADVTLNNQDGRYTSANAGSNLYPYVVPDRPMSIGFVSGADADYEAAIAYDEPATYYQGVGDINVFTGWTEEPRESIDISSEAHVQVRAMGKMQMLRGVQISTLLYSAIRTDEAIEHVLDAAGWPASDRVISVGDSTMNYWWVDKQDAWSALAELLETEGAGAALYEDGQGRVHFENRNYRLITTRSLTSQATYDTDPTTANAGFTAFEYTQSGRDIYNDVHMRVAIKYIWTGRKVWELGDSLTLGSGEQRRIIAHLDDPIQAVTSPVLTDDYVVTSGALSSYTATLVNANTVLLEWTAGSGGAVLDAPSAGTTGPQLRADVLLPSYEEEAAQTAAPAPIFAARTRSLDLNEAGARMEISQPTAQALCDATANLYREGRPQISLELTNRDAARVVEMQTRAISDRVTIDAGSNRFRGDLWIEQMRYEVTLGGRMARLGIVGLQAGLAGTVVESPALWDEGEWDSAVWGN